jgi:hypothetical protein
VFSSHFNFHLLPTAVFRHRVILSGDDRNGTTETAAANRSTASWNRTFDFIRELRQRRKTWRQIAELLLTEKNIRVTVYAAVSFLSAQNETRHKTELGKCREMIPKPNPPAPTQRPAGRSRVHRRCLPQQIFQRPDRTKSQPKTHFT